MQNRGNTLVGILAGNDGWSLMHTPGASMFLNANKKMGFVGGSDHNGGRGPNHVCLTGIWTDDITSDGIWAALHNKKTIACSNGKIAIWAQCEDAKIGESVSVFGEVRIKAWISSNSNINKVSLFRNGEFLKWIDINKNTAYIELTDKPEKDGDYWYSVTAEGKSQFYLNPILCHASPIYVNYSNFEIKT